MPPSCSGAPEAGLLPQRSVLASQVYDYLRTEIVSLRIGPGRNIRIRALGQRLGVSEIPVREALQQLVQRGLVETQPHIGFRVRRLSIQEVGDVFDARILVEDHALAASGSKWDAAVLGEFLSEIERLEDRLATSDQTAWLRDVDRIEHMMHGRLLCEKTDNHVIRRFLETMADLAAITRHLVLAPSLAQEEHKRILLALMDKDVLRARHELRAHLERAKRDTLAGLGELEDPQ